VRLATAYSSSCSQVVLVYLYPFCRNLLLNGASRPKMRSPRCTKFCYKN